MLNLLIRFRVPFLLAGIFLNLACFYVHAQTKTVARFLEVGVNMNTYKGSLAANYNQWDGGLVIGIRAFRKRWVNMHAQFQYGSVTGQDPNYDGPATGQLPVPTPNTYFRTEFFAINGDLQVNILKKSNYAIYVFQGLGFMHFNPKDQYGNSLIDNLSSRAQDEEYSNISAVFPRGFGGFYTLPNGYGLGATLTWLSPATDYIDNVGQWSPLNVTDNVLSVSIKVYIPVVFDVAK